MLEKASVIEKKIMLNEPMNKHTSFKIGGLAEFYIKVNSKEELKQAINFAKNKKIPIQIIGNGSNILVTDKGIKGLVIQIDIKDLKIEKDKKNVKITVGSGYKLMSLARKLLEEEIEGFEELSGIPGTIGGAIFMNAGAYGKEMKDVNISTTCINSEGKEFTLTNKEQEFNYRSSIFSNSKNDFIIIQAQLELKNGNKEEIEKKMDEYLKQRKEKQPLEYPSAGSTFKRQEGIITAKLIDECGLKGYSIGGAMVSKKHAGFIVNYNKATAEDVINLIKYVKEKVNEKFGIKIQEEIRIIGEI